MKLTGRLWPLKMKRSLLHSLLHRSNCSQPGGIFLTFFAYYCRVWHQREEVMRQAEAGCVWWIARWRYHEPWERFYCTVCTLCIYTWDTRWCTGSRQRAGNAGGGGGGVRGIAQGLVDRSRGSWWTHASSNRWPFSMRKGTLKLQYDTESTITLFTSIKDFIHLISQTLR